MFPLQKVITFIAFSFLQYFSQISKESMESYFGDLFNESFSGKYRHMSGNSTLTPSSPDTIRMRHAFASADGFIPRTLNSSHALKDLAKANEKTFIFETPKSVEPHVRNRKPRGLGRMVSCPEVVIIKPVDKVPGRSAGR